MSGWARATDAAIWILILGSLVVFGWFLLEVLRLARDRRRGRRPGEPGHGGPRDAPGGGGRQDSSTRSTSMDDR